MVDELPEWLPSLIPWGGDWAEWGEYCDLVYAEYEKTYTDDDSFEYCGMPVNVRRAPVVDGKTGGFWHMIGGGEGIPEPIRCERVMWARAIIEHADDDAVLVWEEPSRHDGNVMDTVFWLKDAGYYVGLAKRSSCWVIRSAYCVLYESKRKRLEKSYAQYGNGKVSRN